MNNDVFAERVRNKSNPASSWDSWVQIQAESQLDPEFFSREFIFHSLSKNINVCVYHAFHPHTTWLTQASYTGTVYRHK